MGTRRTRIAGAVLALALLAPPALASDLLGRHGAGSAASGPGPDRGPRPHDDAERDVAARAGLRDRTRIPPAHRDGRRHLRVHGELRLGERRVAAAGRRRPLLPPRRRHRHPRPGCRPRPCRHEGLGVRGRLLLRRSAGLRHHRRAGRARSGPLRPPGVGRRRSDRLRLRRGGDPAVPARTGPDLDAGLRWPRPGRDAQQRRPGLSLRRRRRGGRGLAHDGPHRRGPPRRRRGLVRGHGRSAGRLRLRPADLHARSGRDHRRRRDRHPHPPEQPGRGRDHQRPVGGAGPRRRRAVDLPGARLRCR
jgi:hypothetical protein